MNTQKIKPKDFFKNYTALCLALDVTPKTKGNPKIAQLKDIERHLRYTRKGHGFIIEEIFKNPIKKEKNQRNTAPYIDLAKLSLIRLLQDNNNHITMSMSSLSRSLRFVNEDFHFYQNKRSELSSLSQIRLIHIKDFMDTTRDAYRQALKTTLNRLINDGVISVEIKKYVEESYVEIDSDGKKKRIRNHREATKYEIETFLKIQSNLLDSYGLNLQQIYQSGKNNEYFYKLETQLMTLLGVKRVYDCYDIIATPETIDRGYRIEIGDNYKNSDVYQEFVSLWVRERLQRFKNGAIKARENSRTDLEYMSESMKGRLDFAFNNNMEKLANMLIIHNVNDCL